MTPEALMEGIRTLRRGLSAARDDVSRRRQVWLYSGDPAKQQQAQALVITAGRIDAANQALDKVLCDVLVWQVLAEGRLRRELDAEAGEDVRQDFRDVDDGTPPAA